MNSDYSDVMRQCLEDCDVALVRKLWKHVAPNMPQPESDAETLRIIHHARTQCEVVSFRKRAWSHCWLKDHGIPSGLPDELKPKAERMYPRTVSAIGVACGASSELMKPIVKIAERAMLDVVEEHYADGIEDPEIIKPRMMEAKKKVIKQLIGNYEKHTGRDN